MMLHASLPSTSPPSFCHSARCTVIKLGSSDNIAILLRPQMLLAVRCRLELHHKSGVRSEHLNCPRMGHELPPLTRHLHPHRLQGAQEPRCAFTVLAEQKMIKRQWCPVTGRQRQCSLHNIQLPLMLVGDCCGVTTLVTLQWTSLFSFVLTLSAEVSLKKRMTTQNN